ncbi:MAG: ABC transporter permease [Clostridiales bacterium]|nr:ABC transporter permease [Clostridiales bacterium]
MENKYDHIPQEKFEFAQLDAVIHDKKLETKSRGYFADAFIRFKKNKSSVVAACIIAFLVIFAIVAPLVSPYTIKDTENVYVNFPPFIESFADSGSGLFNGGVVYDSQNTAQLANFASIAKETGKDPLVKIMAEQEKTSIKKGREVTTITYKVKINKFYAVGVRYQNLSYEQFAKIQEWQNETGIQVIYPYVDPKDIEGINNNPNIWYKVSDEKGTPVLDANGERIPAYCTNAAKAGAEYNSIRIAGDDGSYIYSYAKSGSVQCRVCYYNYYVYLHGHAPMFLFGTNSMGQDLFNAIGIGARFSLIFAIVVSAINLTLGAIYGAIQGYYGGAVDLILDRISDILSGVPFIVTSTLFQLHLAQKVGVVPSFLFAFVLTGWIGMAALTRKQFYRFKGQEYVLAAKTLGASDWRLMFKHIFPNSLGTIVTSCVLVIPGVISSETTLTYLGIVNLSEFAGTSIGVLMSQGQQAMTTSPHAMFYPALFVSLLLISFNLFGNGLRDAFNPSTRGVED